MGSLRAAAARPFCETFVAIHSDGNAFNCNSYPTVATLPDGRLFLTWEAGDGRSEDTRVVGAFSTDGGRTWSKPQTLIDTPLVDADPTLVLTKTEIQVYSTSRPVSPVTYSETWKTSRRFDGDHWAAPVKMPAHHVYEVGKVHRGLRLGDGTLVLPYSWDIYLEAGKAVAFEGAMKLRSGVLRSQDEGMTWTVGGDMDVDVAKKITARGTGGVCEPAMELLPNGDIYALMRTSDEWLYESRSHDGGLTWDPPRPSPLQSHNAPAALCRLRDSSEVFVAWDHSPRNRWPLDVAISADGCRTWSPPRTLATSPGFQAAYPTATQAADGTLIVVWFQIRPDKGRDLWLARFNREWLFAPESR